MKNLILNLSIKQIRITLVIASIVAVIIGINFFQTFPLYLLWVLLGIERIISLEKIVYKKPLQPKREARELAKMLNIGRVIFLASAIMAVIISFTFFVDMLNLAILWIIAERYLASTRRNYLKLNRI